MRIRFLRGASIVAAFALLSASGCDNGAASGPTAGKSPPSPAAKHDGQDHYEAHEDSPQSYGEAVTKLVALRDKMRDAFAAKNDEEAHEPLHEVGHLLESLPRLADKQTPAIDAESIKQTTDELFDLFSKVDEKMHGAEGAAYSDVASQVDAGVERLQNLIPDDATAQPSQGHVHE